MHIEQIQWRDRGGGALRCRDQDDMRAFGHVGSRSLGMGYSMFSFDAGELHIGMCSKTANTT